MSRFDYVKYDELAESEQKLAKVAVSNLEVIISRIGSHLDPQVDRAFCGRAKSLALTKLEEVYMWIGKAIRDDQMARNAQKENNIPLQEERKNG